ncbi:hypothetical protein ABPG72_007798 [Tetrahymena utriculariae]
MIGYIAIALVLLFVYRFIIKNLMIYFTYKSKFGDKVAFMFYPLLGNFGISRKSFRQYGDSLHILKTIQKTKPDVKAVMIFNGFIIQIIIIDTVLQKLFLQNTKNYYKVEGPFGARDAFGQGIVVSEDKKWARQRNFLSNSFHFNALKNRVPVIKEITKEFLSALPSDGKTPITIIEELQNITSEVIIQTFFGENLKGMTVNGHQPSVEISKIIADGFSYKANSFAYFLKLMIFGQEKASRVLNTTFEKNFLKRVDNYNQFIEGIVDKRLNELEKMTDTSKVDENFLNLYLLEYIKQQKALKENPNQFADYELIPKREIVHQFTTFFFAGMDTTANQTGICLWILAKYPELQQKIRAEIDSVIKTFDDLKHEDLNKLEYFNAFFKESLRIYPTAPQVIPRVSALDHMVDDFPIPKGAFVSNLTIQYNEQKFPALCKDIDTFNPDRFLDKNAIQDHFSFIPYSAGPRNCIGQHLALIEAKIMIAYILKNYVVLPNEEYKNVRFNHLFLYTSYERDIIKLKKLTTA